MHIHLVPTHYVNKESAKDIVGHLQQKNASIKFSLSKKMVISKGQYPEDSELFTLAENYRNQENINPEDFVFILTDSTVNRWFSNLCPTNRKNGYVDIDAVEWKEVINCDPSYPAAAEIVCLFLHHFIFPKAEDIPNYAHEEAIACISDMNTRQGYKNRKEASLRLRTADICMDCMARLKNSFLPFTKIVEAYNLLASLRDKMTYADTFLRSLSDTKMVIGRNGKINFPDLNVSFKPNEQGLALYLLYINHPNGISRSALRTHDKEYYHYYSLLSDNLDIQTPIENVLKGDKNLRTVLCNLNGCFEKHLGKALAMNFCTHYIEKKDKVVFNRAYLTCNIPAYKSKIYP